MFDMCLPYKSFYHLLLGAFWEPCCGSMVHQGFALIPSVDVVALRRETQRWTEPLKKSRAERAGKFHQDLPAQLTFGVVLQDFKCFWIVGMDAQKWRCPNTVWCTEWWVSLLKTEFESIETWRMFELLKIDSWQDKDGQLMFDSPNNRTHRDSDLSHPELLACPHLDELLFPVEWRKIMSPSN